MLLEFSCSNHKSIKGEANFSLVAGKDNSHAENVIDADGTQVLRSAVLYGANGSGKSSFVSALAFVAALVLNSINHQPGQGIRQTPHKLSSLDEPTKYRMQFITGGVRYAYGFSLKRSLVAEEYLYHFPNGRQAMIFERSGDDFKIGSKFRKSQFGTCADVLRPNRLLLSCAANFCSIPEVESAFRFFVDDLVIYDNQEDWMHYSLLLISGSEVEKRAMIAFLNAMGIDVRDIRVTVERGGLDPSHLSSILTDEFKRTIARETEVISAKMVYDQFETDLFGEESTGVRKIISMACPLLDIMSNGKTLICDELEANLHESLVLALVKAFSGSDIRATAQMVFTTHETGILSLDLFRRDQIWFTEMAQEARSTDLYSLAEIKNVRKDENCARGYIAGKYGAIPMLNTDFARIVSQMQHGGRS